MSRPIPHEQRRFATEVVRHLREKGFQAYWAGGCVRDRLLGRTPKDYDVASSATPEQVRDLFGSRRTLLIGAAFGVAAVVGGQAAGTVEVTTFRRDAAYSDGRHPDSVTFSTAEEDAARRDFTINGMFYDPLDERVIDFVGGLEDLAGRRVRAIGRPRDRFAEDKLRMLRAVRFAAAFGFALDLACRAAIAEMSAEIRVVSPERIAAEMRRLLTDSSRVVGVRLLLETGLAAQVLPEIAAGDDAEQRRLDKALKVLARLGRECGFPLALAALLGPFANASAAEGVCRRWRLSNRETDLTTWLVASSNALANAKAMRWSALQPILLSEDIDDLLTFMEAGSQAGREQAAYCRRLLGEPREVLDPPPLVTGDDLLDCGIPSGPQYKTLLQRIRAAQLDGEIRSKAEALAMVEKLREERGERREERGEGRVASRESRVGAKPIAASQSTRTHHFASGFPYG